MDRCAELVKKRDEEKRRQAEEEEEDINQMREADDDSSADDDGDDDEVPNGEKKGKVSKLDHGDEKPGVQEEDTQSKAAKTAGGSSE